MRSLTLLLAAMLAAGPVQAQSGETCVAYMEADHDYGQAETEARSSPSYRAAQIACRETTLEAIEAAGQGIESPAFKNAEKVSRETCDARESVLENLVRPAREKQAIAYISAYKGPKSHKRGVLAKLIRADRERCRRRLER